MRPTRELKAFATVPLELGESREVRFDLRAADLSYWQPRLRRWVVEGGEFAMSVGSSSRDLRGEVRVDVSGEPLWGELTAESTCAEERAHPTGGPLPAAIVDAAPALDEALAGMVDDMPVRVLAGFELFGLEPSELERLLGRAAAAAAGRS